MSLVLPWDSQVQGTAPITPGAQAKATVTDWDSGSCFVTSICIYGLILEGIKCIKYVCLSDVFESPSHSTVNVLLSVFMMCLGRNKLSL